MNILKLLAEIDLNHNQQFLKSQDPRTIRRSLTNNDSLLRYYVPNLARCSWLNHYDQLPLRLFSLVLLLSRDASKVKRLNRAADYRGENENTRRRSQDRESCVDE